MLLLLTHNLLVRLVLEVFNFLFKDFNFFIDFYFNTWLEIRYIAQAVVHLAEDCFVCLQVKI